MSRVLCCVLLIAALISAQVPKFTNSGFIKASNTAISLLLACPWVGDWNGDGKKDLMFGLFSGGKVSLYQNSGTNSAPVFTTSSFLKAGTADIALSAD